MKKSPRQSTPGMAGKRRGKAKMMESRRRLLQQIVQGGESPPATAFETPAFLQNNREALDPTLLKWGPYKFDGKKGLPALPALQGGLATGPKGRGAGEVYLIVQHEGVITKEWREQLLGLEAEILDYMPNNAYVVRLEAASRQAVERLAGTRAVVQYPPDFKLGEGVRELATGPNPYLTKVADVIAPDGTVALRVSLAQGRATAGLATRALGLNPNLRVVHSSEEDGLVAVRVDVTQLAGVVHGLIHDGDVYTVDVVPPMRPMNYERAAYMQSASTTNYAVWAEGLTGYGQIAALYDIPPDTGSCYLRYGASWCGESVCGVGDFPSPLCPDNKVISIRVDRLDDCVDDDGAGGTHGTWVASSMVGDDFSTNGLATETDVTTTAPEQFGLAPGAQLVVFSDHVQLAGGMVRGNLVESIFEWMYEHANSLTKTGQNEWGVYIGARAANLAWGYAFPSIEYDEFAFRTDHALWYMRDFSLFPAGGDAGPNAGTLNGGPQVAKNTITVGAAQAGDPESVDATSSHGPTLDGRIKPDVIAFSGTSMAATGSQLNQTTPTCLTGVYTGTSVASALATGAGVLVYEYFTDGYYPSGADARGTPVDSGRDAAVPVGAEGGSYGTYTGGTGDGFTPSNALVKAVLVNSCRNMTGQYTATVGGGGASADRPTSGQGWGRIVLDDALSFSGEAERQLMVLNDVFNGATTLFDASGIPLAHGEQPRAALETGQTHTFTANVQSGGALGNNGEGGLKITLAWSDPAGAAQASFPAVNNLNLRATAPDGTLYVGNNFTGTSAPWTAPGLVSPDNTNNVECIFLDKSTIAGSKLGPWSIEVLGANIPGNGRTESSRPGGGGVISSVFQGYALVVTGNVVAGNGARLSWDKTAYTCLDQAVVYMRDGSPAKTNFDILLTAYDYAGGVYDYETVTAVNGAAPTWWTNAIAVTDQPPVPENGILETVHGFRLEARHVDEDPLGFVAQASTTTNCAVRLRLLDSRLSGGCDGGGHREEFLDRWEIVTITHTVQIAQMEDVSDLRIDVESLNPNVRVLMEEAYIGAMQAGGTFTFTFTVQELGASNPGDLAELQVLGWSPADGLTSPSGYSRTYELERDWEEEYYNTNYPTGAAGPNPWNGGPWDDLTAAPGGNPDVPATGFNFDDVGAIDGGMQGWRSASFWCNEPYNCCSNHDYVWAEGSVCGSETLYRLPGDPGAGEGAWVQYDETALGCQDDYCFTEALPPPGPDPDLCHVNDPRDYECFKECGGAYPCYNYNFGVLRSPVIEKVHPFTGGIPHQHTAGCTEWHLEFLRTTHWMNYDYQYYGGYPTGASAWFTVVVDGDTADASQCTTRAYSPSQWQSSNISRCCLGNCDVHGGRLGHRGSTGYCWWWRHGQHVDWNSGENKWELMLHADDPAYKDPKVNPSCVPDNLGPEEDQILTPFGQIGDSFRYALTEWSTNWTTPDCVPPYQFGPGGITCPNLPSPPGLGGYFIDDWSLEWTEFRVIDDPTPLSSPCATPDIWFQPAQHSVCASGAKAEIWVQDIAGKSKAGALVVRVRSFNTGDVEDFVLLEQPTLGLFKGFVPLSTEVLVNDAGDMDNVLYVTTMDNMVAEYDPDGIPGNGDELEAAARTDCPTVPVYYLKHVVWDTNACADDDGWLDGGEMADVVVSLNNVSQEASLVNAVVSLRTNDPAVTLCKNVIPYGTVPPLTVVDNASDPFVMCADDALINWPAPIIPHLVEFDVHITADNSEGAPTRQVMVMALDVEADDTGVSPVTWNEDFQMAVEGASSSALMGSGVVPTGRMSFEPDGGLCPLVASFCGDPAEGTQYRAVNDWNITHAGTQLRPGAGGIKGDLPPLDHTDGTGKSFAANHGYNASVESYGGITPLKVDYAYTKGPGGEPQGVPFSLCGESDCGDSVDNDSDGATDIDDREGFEMRFWHLAHMRDDRLDGSHELDAGDGVLVQAFVNWIGDVLDPLTYGLDPMVAILGRWRTLYAVSGAYESFLIGFDDELAAANFAWCRFVPACGRRLPVYQSVGSPPTYLEGDATEVYQFKEAVFDLGDFRGQQVWIRWVYSTMHLQWDVEFDGYLLDDVSITGAVDTPVLLTQDGGAQSCTCCIPPIARLTYEQCAGGRSGTTHPPAFCGDGTCDDGESNFAYGGNCADCECGDGFCDPAETPGNCPPDCPGPAPPVRVFCATPAGTLDALSWSPDVVTLDASCSQWDPVDCAAVQFLWDFENDAVWDLTTANPVITHEFPVLGFPATVRLMVQCPTLESPGQTVAVEVGLAATYCNGCPLLLSDLEPNPVDATPNPTCLGTAVQFDANATGGTGTYSYYEWDFDTDFVTFTVDSVAKNPLHVYPTTGDFRPAVRVWDSAGCSSVWRALPNDPVLIIENAVEFDDSNFVCGESDCADGIDNDADGVIDETSPPLTEVCGDGDGVVEPGEEWDVTVQLKSNLCQATDMMANLELSATSNVISTVTNNPGLFGAIPAGGTATYAYRFQVDPTFTKCGNGIDAALTFSRFDVVNMQSAEEPFYPPALDAFGVQIGEPYPPALVTTFDDCADPPTSNLGNWTVINGGNKVGWTHAGPGCPSACEEELFPTNYYMCDSNCFGWATTNNDELITPLIDMSAATTVTLKFDNDYYNYASPTSSDVNVKSSLTGGAWVTLKDFAAGCGWWGDCATTGTFALNATGQCAGAADCQFEFHQVTNYYDSWWWAVDQVEVHRDAQCDLVPCGAAVRFDPSLDPTTTFTELCGDGDGDVEADEWWEVTVQLKNIGTAAATSVTADLAVGEADVGNNPGAYGDIVPGGTAQYTYDFCMSAQAVCFAGKDLIFDILNVLSLEGVHPAQPTVFQEPLGGASGTCDNPIVCCACACAASVDVATVCLGTPQTFIGTTNASCVTEPLGILYRWDFESDSSIDATGALVGHTYPTPGLYTVTLQTTDSDAPPTETTCTVDVDVLALGVPDVAYDAGFNPTTTLTQICGDGDAAIEPEEQWNVTVQLINNSPCTTAKNVQADLTINAGSAVSAAVQNPGVYSPSSIVPFGTAQATYCISAETAAACIDDITFDVTNITSDEGAYPDNLSVFDVTVGGPGAGETATQQTDPLAASNDSATSDLAPAFTLAAPVDVAELNFTLTYQSYVPSESAATMNDYKAKGSGGESCVNAKTGVENEPFVPPFTLPAPAENFIVDCLISHGTNNVQTCTKVSIIKPDMSECLLKNYGEPPLSPIDRPLCYIGPGTYSLRLCEDETQGPKCGVTAQIDAGATATVEKTDLGGNVTDNAQVELCDPSAACTTLKPYGVAFGAPYDVTALYTGPGVYQVRVSENTATGGQAIVTDGTMFAGDIQCDVAGCIPCDPCVGLACTVSVDVATVCLGTPQNFNVTTAGGFLPIVSYEWDFDYDGVTFDVMDTGQSPTYTYPAAGTYTVACRVTDSCVPVPQVSICVLSGIIVDDQPALAYDPGFDPTTTLTELCGDGDAILEPDEDWEVTVQLINAVTGCSAATNAKASLTVNPGSAVDATVHNNPGLYGTIALGATGQATYCFTVDAGAACVNDITFDVTGVLSDEGPGTDEAPAFNATVGQTGVSETAAQAVDPLVVKGGTATTDLAPAFTIAAGAATNATVGFSLTCQGAGNVDIYTSSGDDLVGWTVGGADAVASSSSISPDICPGGGGNNILMQKSSWIERVVDTTSYNNIVVHTDFLWEELDNGECVTFSYSTTGLGGPWTDWFGPAGPGITCGSGTLPAQYVWHCDYNTGILPPAANDNPNFAIRFAVSGSAINEHLRIDRVIVEGFAPGCNTNADTKVEIIGPLATTWTLKDFGADPATPYDVLAFYEGPGTYQIRLTESSGTGDATLTGASMNVNTDECDVSGACGGLGCGTCTVGILPLAPSICVGGPCVTLTANPSGGVPPYAFLWSPGGETTQMICVSPAVTTQYTVTVTDSDVPPCVKSSSVTFTVGASPSVNILPSNPEFCAGGCVTLNANPSGGSGGYTFLWSPGGETTQLIVVCSPGEYCMTVTDSNGCTGTDCVTVTELPLPTTNIQPDTPSICEGGLVTLTANPGSGTPPFAYLWTTNPPGQPGDNSTKSAVGANPSVTTTYTLVVTDSKGCKGTPPDQETVTVTPSTVTSDIQPNAPVVCPGAPVILDANPSGGTPPYTYDWSTGAKTQTITVSPLVTTTYDVTVTDSSPGGGCTGWSSELVTAENPAADILPDAPTVCAGASLPLDANPSGGTAPYTFVWATAERGAQVTDPLTVVASTVSSDFAPAFTVAAPAAPASVSYTITHAKGAIDLRDCVVVELADPSLTATVLKPQLEVDANPYDVTALYTGPGTYQMRLTEFCGTGSAEITGAEMFVPDALTGDTTQVITVSPVVETTYSVTVTDDNGCEGATEGELVSVDPGSGPTAVITPSGPTTFCAGGSVNLVASTATGTPPFTYQWAPGGQTTQTITVTVADTYSVTITSAAPSLCVDTSAGEVVTVDALPTPTISESCGVPTPADSTLDAGAGYASYLWSTGAKSQTISELCGTGTSYTVTVQDGNECFGTSAPYTVCECPVQLDELEVRADGLAGGSWLIPVHDAAATQYHVYANPLSTFGAAGDEYGSPDGAVLPSVCNAGFTPSGGAATVDYPGVLPDDSWILITAATASAGSESTLGVDSAGTERNTVGTWMMCGP